MTDKDFLTEGVVRAADGAAQCWRKIRVKRGSDSMRIGFGAYQDEPLRPTPVMGEQVTPTWPVTPLRTTPRRPSRVVTEGDDAD